MKKFLPCSSKPRVTRDELGSSIAGALQSLRLLVDPAVEGTPYVGEKYQLKPKKSIERRGGFFSRRFSWRRSLS